ncbi:MAG TPA: FG-GAP-like repeat-containing protein [Saprospiraceae bacterium]|mgnify:CR=1 FL=1|nr:FG-GAP-like repeat-containing protein [Saprospiraceae bacterium]
MKHFCFFLPAAFCCTLGAQQPVFTRITDASNPVVNFSNTQAPYKGLAWIDLDGDNRPDLFMSQRFLFHNDGNGQFTQLTSIPGAQGGQAAAGSSWGDIDNDGDPDCITASAGSGLHLNDGNSSFTLSTGNIPDLQGFAAWDCVLADADNNGLLDPLFVHAEGFHTTGPFPCKFYLQTSPGTFVAQSDYEFTDFNDPYTVPTWTDYDLDGDLDLFIGAGPGNGLGPDYRYKNLLKETGNFSLQRLTAPPFNLFENGQVYNFIDYDNDGDMDGFLTNYIGVASRFWKNENGVLTLTSMPFTQTSNAYLSNVWGDVDNDGDLDVLLSIDGTPQVTLYRNNGNGGFLAAQPAGSADSTPCSIGLADFDNDGDLDFATNGPLGGRALFRNDELASGLHWIAFTLTGTASNRSAIGARIRVKANIDNQSIWQIREVLAHNSFQTQSDLRQHFGLKGATTIDSLEIYWPSGLVQRFGAQNADRFYRITEGEQPEAVSAVTNVIENLPDLKISPNPIAGIFMVEIGPTNLVVQTIQLRDIQGKDIHADVKCLNPNTFEVKLPEILPTGIYSFTLNFTSGQSISRSVVKK